MDIISAAIMIFLIIDPIGNIPVFLSVLKGLPEERRRFVVIRELLFALAIMLLLLFLGHHMLDLLRLRQESVSIAGGIILFIIALHMIFPKRWGLLIEESEGEPFVVPLAIPLISGPSVMAMLLMLVQKAPGRIAEWAMAVLLAWSFSTIILLFSTRLYDVFKTRGLTAIEKLMGMLLVAISVQMLLDGISGYLAMSAKSV